MSKIILPVTTIVALIALAMMFAPIGSARSSQRGDQYVFGKNANVDKPVDGSLQVYGGSARVSAPITGDLLVIGGDVAIVDGGKVGGNVIYGGGNIAGADGHVGGRVYSLATLQGATATITKTAVALSLLFVWFIVAVLITLVSGREVRYSSIEIRASALYCFALGLVAFTSFVLTAIVFSYLVPYLIGIPLLAALAVFAILTKVYGMIAVFHAVGTLVAGSRTREQLASRKWFRGDLAMVVVGILILGAIRLIPAVGPIVWSVSSVFGVGVALATRFGRREPSFLVWRPAEA